MIAVDTNILVRLMTGDDPDQMARAEALLQHGRVFIPTSVMLEAEWVLRSVYGFACERRFSALEALAGLPDVALEHADRVAGALALARQGFDFSDVMHYLAAVDAGCDELATFDLKFARLPNDGPPAVRLL
ncbi:type II toxin-antitoxin system VapC family toxin [Phenylobacterium sp.]|uniref:type II toxin-antitoxin system VapC family toxin n=1 Tax=Phenylobacterium sp. TaxID=1871053 RepID=UPI0025D24199|nr:type II toxin-antitoxin system VapC family toxin [Phenylobacterium sp.]MBX3485069.1 type II toxin-antitoxin system VapC family toxin [Phenylobacterium sp.]MCW5758888.1 type II toxin-antitoxin system VapC family toxin [Phenylobacterium sp.]